MRADETNIKPSFAEQSQGLKQNKCQLKYIHIILFKRMNNLQSEVWDLILGLINDLPPSPERYN